MPSIPIDKVHSLLITPVEDETMIIKSLGTPIFYKEEPSVSETNKLGELTEGQTLTIEPNESNWFIAKEGGAILEVKQATAAEITTAMIDKEAITTEKIKANAVTSEKLGGSAVTEPKIAAEAVTAAKIKKETITATQIANETIGATQIFAGAVVEAKLGAESVSSAKIKKESVTSAKLALASAKPAKAAEKAVEVGAPSPCQKVGFTLTGDAAKTTWKVKHNLETRLVDVELQKAEAEEPSEILLKAAGAGNYTYKAISASEIELTFGTAPGAGVQIFGNVTG